MFKSIIKKIKQNKFVNQFSIYNFRSSINYGFSFLEMVIYIAVLSFVLVILVNSALLMTRSYSNIKISYDINNSAVNIMERLTREIRWSDDFNEENSVFGSDFGTLVLNTIDPDENYVETKFYIENNLLKIKKGIDESSILNNSNISVDRFFLTKVNTPISKMIKIELSLSGSWREGTKSETFYNSVILRESY